MRVHVSTCMCREMIKRRRSSTDNLVLCALNSNKFRVTCAESPEYIDYTTFNLIA